jgi:hypothetical protein
MKTPHRVLSMTRYRDQAKHISRTFDLMRHSVKELGQRGFRRFIEIARNPEISACEKAIGLIGKMSLAPGGTDIDDIKRKKLKKISDDLPLTPTLKWAEYKRRALLDINSSELIIRVALFEAFLKEIHRQILLASPQLLSQCKPNRPIPLKDISQGGFERFKSDEIDRQVREMDRLKTKAKAKFFRRQLRLPWGIMPNVESEVVEEIKELIELRHKVIHMDYLTPVSDKNVKDARQLLLKVPESCIRAAERIYPTHFGIV